MAYKFLRKHLYPHRSFVISSSIYGVGLRPVVVSLSRTWQMKIHFTMLAVVLLLNRSRLQEAGTVIPWRISYLECPEDRPKEGSMKQRDN